LKKIPDPLEPISKPAPYLLFDDAMVKFKLINKRNRNLIMINYSLIDYHRQLIQVLVYC